MARDHGVEFIPHGWNTAVGLAADLQLASAFPGTDLVEYLTGSPFIDEITKEGWRLDSEGMLEIPTSPGLGIEINLEAIAEFSGANVSVLR
jgi:L-alanine-DL-glutamate epimerase-like enolase superfamily enzyme